MKLHNNNYKNKNMENNKNNYKDNNKHFNTQ